jgi:hypothetical protein
MTWDKLIARALVPFEGRMGQLDKRAGLYIDEAQEDFSYYTKCFVKKTNIYVYQEKSYVYLPKDFVELCDQPIFRANPLRKAISNSLDYTRYSTTNLVRVSEPCEYYIESDRLYLMPRPVQSGTLTISYVAVPTSLRTFSNLKQVRFDNVVSEYFDVGKVVKSRIGESNSTTTTATIRRVEYEDALSGVLTLSDITNGFTNNNENFYEASDESAQYELDYGTAWNSFINTWNVLGLGGLAQTNGVQFDFADVSPEISDVYHNYLVDYVKAMIHQDIGNGQEYQNHFSLYIANREKARSTVANKDQGGMSFVADRMNPGSY